MLTREDYRQLAERCDCLQVSVARLASPKHSGRWHWITWRGLQARSNNRRSVFRNIRDAHGAGQERRRGRTARMGSTRTSILEILRNANSSVSVLRSSQATLP